MFIALCLIIQICLQEHCTDAKLNIEHRNENDKTNKLHEDLLAAMKQPTDLQKAVRRQRKSLAFLTKALLSLSLTAKAMKKEKWLL